MTTTETKPVGKGTTVAVSPDLKGKVQAANAHETTQSAALAALVERGLSSNGHAPAPAVPDAPDADQLHAQAMREVGTAHVVLGLVLRLMSDHNATPDDKRAAVDQLRGAIAALEDTL